MIGRRLLHYEIVDVLGQGGMASVYLARDIDLDRPVAIKVLPPGNSDEKHKARFLREARAVSAVRHPHVVTIYDIATDRDITFIAMEYVPGKTLDHLIPPGGMRLEQLLPLAIQITEGLASVHSAGIVHRDLKPSNIAIDEQHFAKLLDFGLAKLMDEVSSHRADATTRDPSLTAESQIVGTVAYMSPEQAQGLALDAGTDIFSFGAVLYEMLTGERAFQGDSFASIVAAVMREQPALLGELTASLPAALTRVVVRCLEKKRENRYRSIAEVTAALAE